jgi:hypothetical protein
MLVKQKIQQVKKEIQKVEHLVLLKILTKAEYAVVAAKLFVE